MLENNRKENFVHQVFVFNVLNQDWLPWLGDGSSSSKDNIFLQKSHDRVQEVSEHEGVDIVIKLVREEFVEPESCFGLFSVHPGTWSFGFITKWCSDFSSHPFQRIVVLQNKSVESPDSIDSFNWVSTFREATFESRSILLDQRINLRNNLYLLFITSFFLIFLFIVNFILIEGVLTVYVH